MAHLIYVLKLSGFIMKTYLISILLLGLVFSQNRFPQAQQKPRNETGARQPAKADLLERQETVDAGLEDPDIKEEFSERVTEAKDAGINLPVKRGFWWPFIPKRCMRDGLTFASTKSALGNLRRLGCAGCWPYSGDTWCWYHRPILCIKKKKSARPPYDVPNPASLHDFYNGWSGGQVRVTTPVRGCFIFSKIHADFICRIHFGLGWRMASFHDGFYMDGMDGSYLSGGSWSWSSVNQGGWNFWAYSTLPVSKKRRYWTYISDQTGNCWD